MSEPVLFVLAHPDLPASRANRACALAAAEVPGVAVHDLYGAYPDLFVEGADERRRLEAAETLVLQHPVYWYAMPGLLKEWVDRTFVHGWAYGTGGTALKGKNFLTSITTGSDVDAYRPGGVHGHPIEDYIKPFRQIAEFCGMVWQEPLVLHHARQVTPEALALHTQTLGRRLAALTGKP